MTEFDRKLARILRQFDQIELAILFGSQAYGDVHPKSDIDIAVYAGEPLPGRLKLELIDAVASELGRSVDIVDLHRLAEPVTGEVFKGRRILGDKATYARLLSRHLIDAADFLPLRRRILAERRDAWIS